MEPVTYRMHCLSGLCGDMTFQFQSRTHYALQASSAAGNTFSGASWTTFLEMEPFECSMQASGAPGHAIVNSSFSVSCLILPQVLVLESLKHVMLGKELTGF